MKKMIVSSMGTIKKEIESSLSTTRSFLYREITPHLLNLVSKKTLAVFIQSFFMAKCRLTPLLFLYIAVS
ncbi:hypothetical protein OKW24_004927 [Peribacillus simplex]|nr:hypothetical protein [Peribacillus simplex]